MRQASVLLVGGVKDRAKQPLVVSADTAISEPVTVPLVCGVGLVPIETTVEPAFPGWANLPTHPSHASLLVFVLSSRATTSIAIAYAVPVVVLTQFIVLGANWSDVSVTGDVLDVVPLSMYVHL